MTLGQKITHLRKARGMTQEELSESVGVTRQTISKWELDTSTPDLDYLCKLCDLLGVTADYLIRPERETVETDHAAEMPASPAPPSISAPSSAEPSPAPPSKKPLNTRPAGWIMLGLAGILLIVALISLLTPNQMPELFAVAVIAAVIALELLLIRWKPLFIVMWTVWLIWTFTQHILLLALFNWALIFDLFWLSYTAFCIGETVAVIIRCVRARRAKR